MGSSKDSFDVIGLISGGKDSFYSLNHCIANSHNVIALANLYPPTESTQSGIEKDLNSFMYQTVGHSVIPLYSKALNLPLYRQAIKGSALNPSKDYHVSSGEDLLGDTSLDETESLMPLLRRVIDAHPTAKAVCSGAILSSYQRTRIESVAQRLGLISLSYLWQYPQLLPPSPGGLLDDMAIAGFDVRIVKVASGGLDEELLWSNLMDPATRRKLQKAVDKFGGSVLGEGGEYETLVIRGPVPFWRGELNVKPEDRFIINGEGGEAWISFSERCGVVAQCEGEQPAQCVSDVRIPGLWDWPFVKLLGAFSKPAAQYVESNNTHESTQSRKVWQAETTIVRRNSTLNLYNMTAPHAATTPSEQMSAINTVLRKILAEYGSANASMIVFTTILLRSQADFRNVNDIYAHFFTRPNPPARVTIACGDSLPPGVHVMVSCVVSLHDGPRDCLHVQSRSYWAPANIGPYSQAVSVPLDLDNPSVRLTYIAGQIPLIPATMKVLQIDQEAADDSSNSDENLFYKRACLCLQHLWRIGKVMNVRYWVGAIAFIVATDEVHSKALIAWEIWERLHQSELWEADDLDTNEDDDDGFDVWNKRYGGSGNHVRNKSEDHRLPNFKLCSNSGWSKVPPFFAVQIDELPRGCDIEWQSSGVASIESLLPAVPPPCSHTAITTDSGLKDLEPMHDLDATIYTPYPDLASNLGMQIIPCRSVWGPGGTRLAAGIVKRDQA